MTFWDFQGSNIKWLATYLTPLRCSISDHFLRAASHQALKRLSYPGTMHMYVAIKNSTWAPTRVNGPSWMSSPTDPLDHHCILLQPHGTSPQNERCPDEPQSTHRTMRNNNKLLLKLLHCGVVYFIVVVTRTLAQVSLSTGHRNHLGPWQTECATLQSAHSSSNPAQFTLGAGPASPF